MKLKRNLTGRILLTGALCLLGALPLQAQQERRNISPDTERLYVISAKAGGVNYVSGDVSVRRKGVRTSQAVTKSSEINSGETVSTGADGKVEVLLNPGSFLRLAENSRFEFLDTSLDSLQIKLSAGSILLETVAVGEGGSEIFVVTPQTKLRLERSGIYRVNVNNGETEVLVWNGLAQVGAQTVKSGRKAVAGKGATTVAKFDKDDSRDELDIWSKTRAKELAKLNNRLQRRGLANAFASYGYGGFMRATAYGFWVFDRFTGTHCFVPNGWWAWGSPYGYGYGRNIYWGNPWKPPIVVTPQPPQPQGDFPTTRDTRGSMGGGSSQPAAPQNLPIPVTTRSSGKGNQ